MELEQLKQAIADAYEDDIEALCALLEITAHTLVNTFEHRVDAMRDNFQGLDVEPIDLYEDGDGDTEGNW